MTFTSAQAKEESKCTKPAGGISETREIALRIDKSEKLISEPVRGDTFGAG